MGIWKLTCSTSLCFCCSRSFTFILGIIINAKNESFYGSVSVTTRTLNCQWHCSTFPFPPGANYLLSFSAPLLSFRSFFVHVPVQALLSSESPEWCIRKSLNAGECKKLSCSVLELGHRLSFLFFSFSSSKSDFVSLCVSSPRLWVWNWMRVTLWRTSSLSKGRGLRVSRISGDKKLPCDLCATSDITTQI